MLCRGVCTFMCRVVDRMTMLYYRSNTMYIISINIKIFEPAAIRALAKNIIWTEISLRRFQ